ncbi:glycosyl hydrolase family 18 protein [Algicola sagamiensis]|uniref:glycosyl hydrolase family 18 protein n=1 Tax=Algicola sagamiensis TaxID=163869 RepID=UPI00039A075B|nr:glycosyl hydrolase family 18 protein [Algicola sagamiensis]
MINKILLFTASAVLFSLTSQADLIRASHQICPSDYIHVTPQEAEMNREKLCQQLDTWDIARLSGNASMDGPGYGCGQRSFDDRQLGPSLCKSIQKVAQEECPHGTFHVTSEEVAQNMEKICGMLDRWDIARLHGSASLSGSGYGCSIIEKDTRSLGAAMCKPIANDAPGRPNSDLMKVAYVEVNDHPVRDAGCFVEDDGEPLFDIAVIFAANINYDGQKAVLHLNRQVTDLLENNLHQVRELQAKGIKVVLDVLGNHQNAGWSCFADDAKARAFAHVLKTAVEQYGLDGIDIDDEYSKCDREYDDSLIKVTSALREIMPNKIISKALFHDQRHFDAQWQGKKLHEQLSYGWEMSYWAAGCGRVNGYLNAGMSKKKLGIGVSTTITSTSTANDISACLKSQKLGGGMMVFNVSRHSEAFLQAIWPNVTADQSCLNR